VGCGAKSRPSRIVNITVT